MSSKFSVLLKAGFFFACVILLVASFLITLVEAIIVQLLDSELEAMILYTVSIAAIISALGLWKYTRRTMELAILS